MATGRCLRLSFSGGAAMMNRLAALVFCLILLPVTQVIAAEEILSFDSVIQVQTDGSVVVTEEIRVRAEGRQIRRGIYRDLPVYTVGPLGDRRSGGFELLGVSKDGRDEPYHTERINEDIRIYAGRASVLLSTGVYTYTFRYRIDHQVGFFDGYDEIYWNVTGTRWSFPIRSVTARVVTPEGAKVLQNAAYTGPRGAKGKDFRVSILAGNMAEFTTTRTLRPGEGITVATGWPKGFVTEPDTSELASRWFYNNIGLLSLFGGTIGVLLYYFKTWLRVGRDPRKGVIIPLFHPPDDLSPAAISYIHYMDFLSAGRGASKALIAAFISLAVKGKVRIDEDEDEDVTVHAVDRDLSGLPAGEAALLDHLFRRSDKFDFSKHSATRYASARSSFRSAILREHKDVFFRNNRGHFVVGIGLTIATVVAFFVLQRPPDDQIGTMIAAGVGTLVGSLLIVAGRWSLFNPAAGLIRKVFGFLLAAAGVFVLGLLCWLLISLEMYMTVPGIVLALLLVGLVVFYNLLRAPTPVGREVMDRIEGFKLYLSVAEAERMNMQGVPEMSETLFERLLPYAVALNVEKPWSEAFSDYLARVMPDQDDGGYHPGWYRGRHWDGNNVGRATEGMVSSMSGAMAAATPSSSGSGSSGGGSSGGGGGGGGGGGW